MGKKRRLKSARGKFATKHSSHPRAKFLASSTETVATIEDPATSTMHQAEVILEELSTPATLTPDPVKAAPKAEKVTKTRAPRKKRVPAPRKRTTKKKTNSPTA
jgi:hypothetical protein